MEIPEIDLARGGSMPHPTEPNPFYLNARPDRKVRMDCWEEAIKLAKLVTNDVQIYLDAVKRIPAGTTREEGNKLFLGSSRAATITKGGHSCH
jgi:hypothetical protein